MDLMLYGALLLAQAGTSTKQFTMKKCGSIAPGAFNSVSINLARALICLAVSTIIWIFTVGAHVSACPNHQTLRMTPLATRFDVAAFGVLGYECNLCDMSAEEKKQIREQIALYKKWREVLQFGHFYRGRSDNIYEWTCVSEDGSRAVGMLLQVLTDPNYAFTQFFPRGLDSEVRYHFYNIERKVRIKPFGDLVNMLSPIHIKYDSLVHNIVDKFVKMPGEVEDYTAYGSTLMKGVKLKAAFAGTGFDENTRFFRDFSSRMYFMEKVDQ